MTGTCPVCEGASIDDTVRRAGLPAMQNLVHRTRESAVAAARGELTLAVCRTCGFAWNRTFEASRLSYDTGYDNTVPSAVMHAYYRDLASSLAARYDLPGRLVLDVGCGNGMFLRTLCDSVPGARGLGVDPALDRDRAERGGAIVLRKAAFSPRLVDEAPALVVSRHVLEHVPEPVAFLRELAAVGVGTPCFLEVPDLRWIVESGAYWDFCYEHCNYFTAASLAGAARRAGLVPTATRTSFGAQYLCVEARAEEEPQESLVADGGGWADRLLAYAGAESELLESTRASLAGWKRDGKAVAVWGMATKGVLFSLLADPEARLLDACVDVNPNKQGCFVPVSGHLISAPVALQAIPQDGGLVVVVMNANYLEEIRVACAELGLDSARLIDAGVLGSEQA